MADLSNQRDDIHALSGGKMPSLTRGRVRKARQDAYAVREGASKLVSKGSTRGFSGESFGVGTDGDQWISNPMVPPNCLKLWRDSGAVRELSESGS